LDFLDKLLAFDPANRPTVEEALKHPYLELYHDENDEPSCPNMFDFSFESVQQVGDMKRNLYH
jgi:mitogen-activated protein kinase 7